MARSVTTPVFRFVPGSGSTADTDGSDGGSTDSCLSYLASVGYAFFPAVYDNGGTPARCSYLSTFGLDARWSAAGFTQETFLVNVDGVSTPWILTTSVAAPGAIPFGAAVFFDNLTQDGVTNVSRWLARVV